MSSPNDPSTTTIEFTGVAPATVRLLVGCPKPTDCDGPSKTCPCLAGQPVHDDAVCAIFVGPPFSSCTCGAGA